MSRISYRNYPVLKSIKDGNLNSLVCHKDDLEQFHRNEKKITQIFAEQSKNFDNICYVSKNFIDALQKSNTKIRKIYLDELLKGDAVYKGTIMSSDFFVSYHLEFSGEDMKMVIIEFFRDEVCIRNVMTFGCYGDLNHITTYENEKALTQDGYATDMMDFILCVLTFKKYAKVEIVESKARSKTTQIGCKYLNETDLDIEYLDSKWFTSLVNSEGFKVRGFFRMQPKKKDGEWTKELIWVDEFDKKGYNRQAKILSQKEN